MRGTTFARAAVALTAIATTAGALAAGRAFTIADHYRVVGVADPQVSGDGARIAYVTTHTDLPAATRWSDLFVAGIDGAGARQLTTGKRSPSSPRWSPDGSTLAYVSADGDGTPQVFLMPMEGGSRNSSRRSPWVSPTPCGRRTGGSSPSPPTSTPSAAQTAPATRRSPAPGRTAP